MHDDIPLGYIFLFIGLFIGNILFLSSLVNFTDTVDWVAGVLLSAVISLIELFGILLLKITTHFLIRTICQANNELDRDLKEFMREEI